MLGFYSAYVSIFILILIYYYGGGHNFTNA